MAGFAILGTTEPDFYRGSATGIPRKKYPCNGPCERKSFETICENIVSRYQILVSSLPRETTFRHRRPNAEFMTGPHRQPSNNQSHRAAIMSWEMILNDWFTKQTTPACRNAVFFIIDLKTKRLDSIR